MTIAELIKDLTEYAKDSEKGFDTEVRSYVGMSRQAAEQRLQGCITDYRQVQEGAGMMPKEINIICVGDLRYRFSQAEIKSWDFDYSDDVLRIDFTDNSFIEFYKRNIICVEFNKEIEGKEQE